MDRISFEKWLEKNKKMSEKSAHDVISRLNRVLRMTGEEKVTDQTLNKIAQNEEFGKASTFIRCQLKRSIHLFQEFTKLD